MGGSKTSSVGSGRFRYFLSHFRACLVRLRYDKALLSIRGDAFPGDPRRFIRYTAIPSDVFLTACSDYATDRRGDVGSWVREVREGRVGACEDFSACFRVFQVVNR